MIENSWEKLGSIYNAGSTNKYLLTHSSNPLAIHLKEDIYRIFYSARDENNKSSISYVDYDVVKMMVVNDPKKPMITYGSENSFYSHGITIGNYWLEKNDTYIGFMGWQHRGSDHWRGDIGKFNIKTKKVDLVLSKNKIDKVSLSYPCIIKDKNIYKMWYGSTISWESGSIDKEMIHTINYAESKDTKKWDTKGVAIPWELNKAQAFSKPSVLVSTGGYQMWYSYRKGDGSKYKIGYSYSPNGKDWNFSESKLVCSNSGWDAEMVCYPYVFKHNKNTYMLYNGNRFGKYGFGLAQMKEE